MKIKLNSLWCLMALGISKLKHELNVSQIQARKNDNCHACSFDLTP